MYREILVQMCVRVCMRVVRQMAEGIVGLRCLPMPVAMSVTVSAANTTAEQAASIQALTGHHTDTGATTRPRATRSSGLCPRASSKADDRSTHVAFVKGYW